jgi:hypothetical protein
MSTAKNNNEEEVDLGSLFVIIGKGFKNFFNFIGSIFKGIFHRFILILIFLRFHLIKFAVAALIGAIAGFFLENSKEIKFSSNLIVQPNFESAQNLYKNINYYNDLITQKNTQELSSIFKLDSSKAASLRKFEITPITNRNDVINAYDKFILEVDTLTVKSYDFDDFEENFTDFDYLNHEIEVVATVNDVFSSLDNIIIETVEKNQYFNRIKKLTNENLTRTDSLLRENLIKVDSLRQVYMRVMLEESKKEFTGTSIDLGGTKTSAKEIELFRTDREINEDLGLIAESIGEKSEVINIVSSFQSIGYEVKGITKNYIFIVAGLSVILVLLIILFLDLNRYLDSYKK